MTLTLSTYDDIIELLKLGFISLESIKSRLPNDFFNDFDIEYDDIFHENETREIIRLSDLNYNLTIPLVFDGDSYNIRCVIGTPQSYFIEDDISTTTLEFFISSHIDTLPEGLKLSDMGKRYSITSSQQAYDLLINEWPKFVNECFDSILDHKKLILDNLSDVMDLLDSNTAIKYSRKQNIKTYCKILDYLPTQLINCKSQVLKFENMELDCIGRTQAELDWRDGMLSDSDNLNRLIGKVKNS